METETIPQSITNHIFIHKTHPQRIHEIHKQKPQQVQKWFLNVGHKRPVVVFVPLSGFRFAIQVVIALCHMPIPDFYNSTYSHMQKWKTHSDMGLG